MRDLLGRIILVAGFSLSSLEVPLPLACSVFPEKSADNLMGIPLYVLCCFSLIAFSIFSLSLIFVNLITMFLSVFLLVIILYGTLCFLYLGDCFLFHVMEVFSYCLFLYFLTPFLSLFSFWDSYNANVGAFNVVLEVS